MQSRRQASWSFDAPPRVTGAFLRTMTAETADEASASAVVEIELRDGDGKHLYDCHINVRFDAHAEHVEPTGGTILAGDAGESFAVAGTDATGRQSLAPDHPLIAQLATMLNDPRIVGLLRAFVAGRS